MPSPSESVHESQALPTPSPSESACTGFAIRSQLSQSSGMPSESLSNKVFRQSLSISFGQKSQASASPSPSESRALLPAGQISHSFPIPSLSISICNAFGLNMQLSGPLPITHVLL